DYNVSDNMTPVMDPYNSASMRFLAIKLREGRGNSNIAPLQFTYASEQPMIPIQLTAVAAQPHMSVLVFILADTPFVPSNYSFQPVDPTQILVDASYRSNYFDWVARTVDEAGGQHFIAEYADNSPSIRGHTFVSRYYTRMSAHQMTMDPVFVPDSDFRASSVLDLSNNMPLYQCGQLIMENLPSACAFNYCGLGATCIETGPNPSVGNPSGATVFGDLTEGIACICPGDQVAQNVQGPDGQFRVACVPARNPVGVTDEAAGVGSEFDPCSNFDCGAGQCVVKGGFSTCACEENAVAILNAGLPSCVPKPENAPTFGSGAGLESSPALASTLRPTSLDLVRDMVATLLPTLLFAGALMGLRRAM
ncbi:MAG: DUF2330 domain-containing protein, partial [Myxococcota bacterium]